MEPLFRITLLRPAVAQDPDNGSIELAQDTPFQQGLADAARAQQARNALLRLARAYISSENFIGSPSQNPLAAKLERFAEALDAFEDAPDLSRDQLVEAVQAAFDLTPTEVTDTNEFRSALTNLRDSLLAIKQVQEEHSRPIEALANQLRDLELINKLASHDDSISSPEELNRLRRRSLKLPIPIKLKPVISTAAVEENRRKILAEEAERRKKQATELYTRYTALRQAVSELTALPSEQFQTTPQEPHPGRDVSKQANPQVVLDKQVNYFTRLSELNLKQIQVSIEQNNGSDAINPRDLAGAGSAAALSDNIFSNSPRLLDGAPPFRPMSLGEVSFRLKPGAAEALSETTRAVLSERRLGVADRPLDVIVTQLVGETDSMGKELDLLVGQPVQKGIRRFGSTLVTVTKPFAPWFDPAIFPNLPQFESIPSTHGDVVPAGVADLLIIKQQLVGYEGADIAHIENVLRGESKSREHIRRRETEELTFRETEITSSEERELESTDRFEMTRETNTTIREEASLKAGLTISGKYGPTVEFSASAEGSMSRSKEEATRAASNFSKEVTQRSAIKITERVLERASLRVTNEVIEKNTHALNNTEGAGHISGVYQWVNKVYQAQMFNYGQRVMFDFMVPEPAAFLIQALNSAHDSAVELQKPAEFTLKPNEISDTIDSPGYYGRWVRLYGATDVTPPPELYKTKSLDFKAGGGDDKTSYNHSAVITIDDGYRAVQGSVGKLINHWDNTWTVDVILGRRAHRFSQSTDWVWVSALDDERDSIPFILDTFRIAQVSAAVEVKCQRTDRAMEVWRSNTHAKLTAAYKARLAEYEEKLAALEASAGIVIQGRNPAANLEIMYDELKKHCISILTDQHYDLFNAIDIASSNNLPQINVSEAAIEGSYVRFLEQAFEWEHLTWVTYPYFWGRKNQWDERLAFEDPDPLFNQFLKAGFCRVSVPGRPGFEGAIDHFINYGELWNGGPLPPISSDLYLPIADELAERLDRPGDELPQGDPWQVRIPTTLVHLRPDDRLPRWQQDENGSWVEV